MSIDSHSGENTMAKDGETEQDDSVARLMNLAGLRPDVSADIEARVYDHVRREWRNSLPVSHTRKWAIPLAIAASILLAVSIVRSPVTPDGALVGTVATISSEFGATSAGLTVGDTVSVGDTLTTRDGQLLNIALPNNTSVRLAENTSLQLDDRYRFTLVTGTVYADSGILASPGSNLEIQTGVGVITDIGTQFLVSFVDDELGVAVREGRVDVTAERDTYTTRAGDSLMLLAGSPAVMGKIGATDSAWDWTLDVASDFEVENSSVLNFLEWVSRETGKELIFSSDEIRADAMTTILYGPVSDLKPSEAAVTMLATTKFDYRIDETSIVLGR